MEKSRKTSRHHELLQGVAAAGRRLGLAGQSLVVGSSGGPDSQALLHALVQLREALKLGAIWAVGVDHGLRPHQASQELDVAEHLATALGLTFERLSVRLPKGGNVLNEARKVRYAALHAAAQRLGAGFVAVAHTATDQVETVLMRLLSGAGLGGMTGIAERRGQVVRPLLTVGRQAVLNYLEVHQLPFATDPSNASLTRVRGLLRAEVLPALGAINPRFEASVGRFVEGARLDEAYLSAKAHKLVQRYRNQQGSLDATALKTVPQPLCQRVVALWLKGHGVQANHAKITELVRWLGAAKNCGGLSLTGGHVRLERQRLFVVRHKEHYCMNLNPGNTLAVPGFEGSGLRSSLWDAKAFTAAALAGRLEDGRLVAFDADRLHLSLGTRPGFALNLRGWQPGDRLAPYGGVGHLKVGNLFTNMKVPTTLRKAWPLVWHESPQSSKSLAVQDGATGRRDVLWVVGLRRSSIAPLSAATERMLVIELQGAPLWKLV